MRAFAYRSTTSGEALYQFFRNWLVEGIPSDLLDQWLSRIEYGEDWSEFVEQLIAVWLTGRSVAMGRSLKTLDGDSYQQRLGSFFRENLAVKKRDMRDLVRRTETAVDAAEKDLSQGLKNQFTRWARSDHAFCYMCATELDFERVNVPNSFTREHIWPQSYGGDSILENLLPACAKCNAERKSSFATWAATSIQSAVLRMNPSDEDWKNLKGYHFFALHHYAGQRYAVENRLSLKEAFRKIGPWKSPPQILDANDVVHFFNITNVFAV
jgi:hypothetical protein